MDYLRLGDGPVQVWLYARQHPGESMAEWWMEGALSALTDPRGSGRARLLRQKATFHIVPNMNPDGCAARPSAHQCGGRPTSTANGQAPTAERSPEVLCVRNGMDETGVDFAMDVHGDEAIPAMSFSPGSRASPR